MNKKQLFITIVLIVLMLSLTVVQMFLGEKFDNLVLRYNNINGFKEYSFDENNYVILLPEEWTVTKNKNQYLDMYCFSNNNSITGSLCVLNNRGDIKKFIDKDSKNQLLNFNNLNIVPYTNKNRTGYLSTYNTEIRGGNSYINRCYYIKTKSGQIVKILFNVKDKEYKENIEKVCDYIVESIESV